MPKHLSIFDISKRAVQAPPLPEQHKIARILSTVDEQIERTEALIAKYQAMKQGLMNDLLTRGVDRQGRLRSPREQAPELYKWSAMGWAPRGWEVETIRTAIDFITDYRLLPRSSGQTSSNQNRPHARSADGAGAGGGGSR